MLIMRSLCTLVVLIMVGATTAHSQDSAFGRRMLNTLASEEYWGRGYTKGGLEKAAQFISAKMVGMGLRPMNGGSYFQPLSYDVNTFHGEMSLSLNGKKLVAGEDYIVTPESKGIVAKGTLEQRDSVTFLSKENRLIVQLKEKLTWSVATEVADYTIVDINRKKWAETPSTFDVNIENKFVKDFPTGNLCGMVVGTTHPDSIIMLTAHYDHLGGMGKDTYFPGANDNASGVSLLIGLMQYYEEHPVDYSMVFVFFTGEEAGLIGSKYFTEHPLVDLKKVRFLFNLDLEGTGVGGATVVNATEYSTEFNYLKEVNNQGKYLAQINARGKAANSDHYWFGKKGVPAFFMYTMGGIAAYHDVFDRANTLPMDNYWNLSKLIEGFVGKLMGK